MQISPQVLSTKEVISSLTSPDFSFPQVWKKKNPNAINIDAAIITDTNYYTCKQN